MADFLPFCRILEGTGECGCDRRIGPDRKHAGFQRIEIGIDRRDGNSANEADLAGFTDIASEDAGQVTAKIVVVGDGDHVGNRRIERIAEQLDPFCIRIGGSDGLERLGNLVERGNHHCCAGIPRVRKMVS